VALSARRDRPAECALVRAAQAGDPSARAQLIERLRPLVAVVARSYRGCPAVDRGELMQEGVVGVLRALERYDSSYETPFWAYAAWWVRQAMQRLVAELGQPVVLSDRALRQLAQVKSARHACMQASGSEPSCARLAAATGLTREQVEQLVAAERLPRSLDEPLGGQGEWSTTVGDLLADPAAEDEYERALGRLEAPRPSGCLGGLDERARTVLRARFGFDGHQQTLRQIAGQLGLSAERVRQIEQGALAELRNS
jgi:RNA polymerase sigma factor (sigma-70 family)